MISTLLLSESDLAKNIKSGNISGGYLFFGEEDYTKKFYLKKIREAVCTDKSFDTFNYINFTSLDYTHEKLLDAFESMPMMAEKKLVVLSGISLDLLRNEEVNNLVSAIGTLTEYDYTVFVLCLPEGGIDEGRLPKYPSAIMSKLCGEQMLTGVAFRKSSPQRLAVWVGKHFEANKITAPPDICAKLVEYAGTSMYTLSGEIDKISFYLLSNGRHEVTYEDIKKVSIPDISFDTFDFANAITYGNKARALDILYVLKSRKTEPTMILGSISAAFCDMLCVRELYDMGYNRDKIADTLKMNSYKVGIYMSAVENISAEKLHDIVGMCADADAELKAGNNSFEAIERLICAT